ncbi:DUF3889 domain-containing protein [Aquibacillus rhizosphaerae]|uniref:DUF3889 domain-containing protein n=1 Tax=Aquibacillus rhizosphaerae TaxID=3051431 RepID=A0ABT7LBK8_9BACI|nr:DUF3889 domain-containing protein [Aquibacillus sp. LR5S19]MDL4843256.1 DUF3889 domain-containing protein [Aquibacillus sp. LR5S19]
MYANYPYFSYGNPNVTYPTGQEKYEHWNANPVPYSYLRQQPIQGQAYWTDGGPITQCGIPWSTNQFMTAAVGATTNYQCGETLKVKNISNNREVIVTIVDKVPGFLANQINVHRKAFETLGANPSIGVINVEMTYSPELEQEKWGKYLLEITQAGYPSYNVTEYNLVNKTNVSPTQEKEVYEFILKSSQETKKVRGNVAYNPRTDRIIAFDIQEVGM